MKLPTRRLWKQQAETTVNKLHDPKTNQPKYEPKEIENICRNYYKELYTQSLAPNQKAAVLVLFCLLSTLSH